ncbi:MAG: hypothetical protein JSV87_01615, partial [Candidatus Bathyarchaeota archaeon]
LVVEPYDDWYRFIEVRSEDQGDGTVRGLSAKLEGADNKPLYVAETHMNLPKSSAVQVEILECLRDAAAN